MATPVAVAVLLASPAAYASCNLVIATVTCTGTTAGFGDGSQSGLTINILTGATVSSDPAINIADTNTINNSGSILSLGAGGIGILLTDNNTINNSGAIHVGTDGDTIRGVGVTGNTVTNTGTIDGRITLVGAGNSVTNSGLLTITDPNTSSGFAHNSNSFTQTAGGTLAPQVDNLSGMAGSVLTQNATIDGKLRAIVRPGLYDPTTTYLGIVTAALTLTGTFSSVVSSSPFLNATVATTGNNIDLTLTRIGFGSVPGATANQQAVGNALEGAYSTTLTGNAATFYGNLLAATSVNVFDQLSGEGTSAAQGASFTAGNMFTTTMLQQGMLWLNGTPGGGNSVTFGGPLQYAAADKPNKLGYEAFASVRPQASPEPGRWRAWGAGFGARHSVNGEAATGSSDQSQRSAGGAVGVDHQISADLLLGFSAGGSESTFSVSNLATSGRIDGGHIGVYAIKTLGAAYIAATLNYARLDNKTDRTITGIGPTETATGSFHSDQLSGRLELGWKRGFDGYSITPFVAIEPATLWQHAYSETSTTSGGGPGVLGLSYQSNTVTSLPTFLGAQVDARYALAGGQTLSPFARAAWVHEFEPERQIQASFISVPTAAFTVDGARAAHDALRVDTGATLALNRVTSLFASINGEYSDRSRTYAAMGGAKMTW